jgi:hemolysin activation/secretion protein
VLENELYRIGGNRLLRGFDELSILTDYYAVLTSEFRLLLNTDSYLSFPFIDFSRMRTFVEGEPIIDNAYGIGLGLNFSTKSGIFNISFAAGSRLQNPIDFNNTKVHFGYVNLF